MVIIEKSFPRGGTVKSQDQRNDVGFGARQEKRKKDKQKKKEKISGNVEIPQEIKAISAELLSHRTVQEGMVIMGVVKSVDPTLLKVSLPGRIVGHVLASSISESYNKLMHMYVDGQGIESETFKPLPDLFHVGQVICAKVVEISSTEEGRLHIKLSLKPGDLHSEFNHQHLRKGQMMFGAIDEVQDHGYVIESGVRNLRCFLPFESSEEGLCVGSIVCVRIEKLTQASTASTAVCRSAERGNRKIKDLTDPNLDYILPTTVVNFTVTKILKDGLQGTIMNGTFIAYINEHQLAETLHIPTDYSVNDTLSARVLYVMPLSKLIYLTLRTSTDLAKKEQFARGDLIHGALVHHIGTGGVIVDLEGKGKGLISFKSIKANYVGNYDQDEMFAKYKKNTKLKVRIIEYDLIDDLYSCTDNPVVVNQKFYTLEDLKPGEYVTGVVEQKDEFGNYFIRVGNVRGLVEKMFLASNSGNLKERAKINCRVIWINPDRNIAYLTNRSEYMSKVAKVPTQMSAIKPNRVFLGTIVKQNDTCYIVRFFANIKGILYKNKMSLMRGNEFIAFYEGATMKFRIVSKNGGKITLGFAEEMHKIGEICEATVTNIIQHGLEISIPGEGEEQIKGLVPVRLLSDFQDIVGGHLKTYSLDDEITVACMLKNLYSVRDVAQFQQGPVKQWKDIQPGDIIKSVVKNVEGEIIEVLLPIRNYNKLIKIHMKMFVEGTINEGNIVLVPDQVVFVKVLSKENISKSLTLSAKLTEVWDCHLKTTGELFARFLNEAKKIKKAVRSQGKLIGSFKIGEKVNGKITSFSKIDGDWMVELPNNVQGLIRIPEGFTDKTLKIGKEVSCTILWIDYAMEVLCLNHKTADGNRIVPGLKLSDNHKNQTGINAKVLWKTNEFLLCSLKKGQNSIFFVPAKLHFNDFENTSVANIKQGDFVRLAVIHDKYPIAVLEKTWKFWKRMEQPKRKIESQGSEVPKKRLKVMRGNDNKTESGSSSVKRVYEPLLQGIDADMRDVEDTEHNFKGNKRAEKGSAKSVKRKRMEEAKKEVDTDESYSERPSEEDDMIIDENNEEEIAGEEENSDDEDASDQEDQADAAGSSTNSSEDEDVENEATSDAEIENGSASDEEEEYGAVSSIANDESKENSSEDEDVENEATDDVEGSANDEDEESSEVGEEGVDEDVEEEQEAAESDDSISVQDENEGNASDGVDEGTESDGTEASDDNEVNTKLVNGNAGNVQDNSENSSDEGSAVGNRSNKKTFTDEELKANLIKDMLAGSKTRGKQMRVKTNPLLPGANDFWSTDLEKLQTPAKKQPDSSSDESGNEDTTTKKKKKQTAAEKFKAAREEEARLRKIEENYANPNKLPETVDEFDRMVMANPNSSIKWINYMVFHLQAAEIDKARTVARRALKSISFREEQELLNIWVALLNLELRYGTKESFNEILKEATLCNDAYKIYTRCLQILTDAKKIEEINELIPTLTRKFRNKPDIWKHTAIAYFEVGLADKAKQLLHKALATLPERDHIYTIITFANIHHKYNNKEVAHSLLDQIVTSYPKRVDVWSQYVDMLVKDNDIESARKALERSVSQRIPMKKMHSLFKKYLQFEQKHGSKETVENVKQMAANYVKNEIG